MSNKIILLIASQTLGPTSFTQLLGKPNKQDVVSPCRKGLYRKAPVL